MNLSLLSFCDFVLFSGSLFVIGLLHLMYRGTSFKMIVEFFLISTSVSIALHIIASLPSNIISQYEANYNVLSKVLFCFCVVSFPSVVLTNYFFNLVIMSFLIPSFVMLFFNLNSPHFVSLKILTTVAVIFNCLVFTINSSSLITLVFGFELIVFLTLYLLVITIKTDSGLTAVVELFLWAIFGSFFLITGLAMLINSTNFLWDFHTLSWVSGLGVLLLVFGFAVNIPLWPFTSWLLNAHVEASTEFSIFLSGFLVNFGVVVLWNIITLLHVSTLTHLLTTLATLGLLSAAVTLLSQVDLKKIVAICTVIEMNWLVFMLFISFDTVLVNLSLILMLVHSTMTTVEFYSVDILYSIYNTSTYFDISGFSYLSVIGSSLMWVMVFIIIGIPGTSVFFCKLLFFTHVSCMGYFFYWLWCIVFFIVLPVFFINLWSSVLGSLPSTNSIISPGTIMSTYDIYLFILCLGLNIILGVFMFIVF